MSRRTLRRWSVAAGALVATIVVALSAFVLNGAGPAGPASAEVEGEMPTALAGHLDNLMEAVPGDGDTCDPRGMYFGGRSGWLESAGSSIDRVGDLFADDRGPDRHT